MSVGMAFRLSEAIPTPGLEKDIFYISHPPQRACPTAGSDRGSLRSHDLTLLVRRLMSFLLLSGIGLSEERIM